MNATDEQMTFPCAASSLRYWFEEQFAPHNPALNVTAQWQVSGDVWHAIFEAAWRRLIDRHAALRTALRSTGDEPAAFVEAGVPFSIPIFDLRGMSGSAQAVEAERLASIESQTQFDLGRAPLIRVARLLLADTRTVLLVTAHAAMCDRFSLGVLRAELQTILAAHAARVEPQLPALATDSGEFAAQQRSQTSPHRLTRERDIVRDLLHGWKQFEVLPDRPRPRRFTSNGDVVSTTLDRTQTAAFIELAKHSGETPFATALAALFTFLYRFSGETDILLSTQVPGRDEPAHATLVGAFENTIGVRGDLSGQPDFLTVQDRTRAMLASSMAAGRLPLQDLIEIAAPLRDASRNPVFSVNVTYDTLTVDAAVAETIAVVALPSPPAGVFYDLDFGLEESRDGLRIACSYNTDLFDRVTIVRLLAGFRTLLVSATADPRCSIDELAVLADADYHELVGTSNQTRSAYPSGATLPQLIAEQSLRSPDALAVRCGQTRLTYAELMGAVSALARRIVRAGCGPGMHVGILLDRSCDMLVAMLAVQQAGCAYIPLDPRYPVDRLSFIATDSAIVATITRADLADLIPVPNLRRILVDVPDDAAAPRADATPLPTGSSADIAYVIYTSGSTGRPKGVQISHAALINLLWAMRERPGMSARDTLVAVTTISFDIAGLELFLPLVCGAAVVIANEAEVVDGHALLGLLRHVKATVMQATPVTWQLLLDAGWRGEPRLRMLCGGEALPRPLAAALIECGGELWNMYGPTETTIWSAAAPVHADAGSGPVLIGPPIANTQFYVLDRNGRLAPPGAPGELFIGGDGLARGYLGRDALTLERFVPDAFAAAPGARMYRTGDIVRLRAGGYEFLGRTDHQIKLRGFRIELDEITAALLRQPGVADAAAIVVGSDSDAAIRAFVVGTMEAHMDVAALRSRLAEFLPAYMLPATIVALELLPRTPNGKTDRAALERIRFETAVATDGLPGTPVEIAVARLVCDVLGRAAIGRDADLFAAGFHSLSVVRLIARIKETFDVQLAVRDVFDDPRVSALARMIEAGAQSTLHRAAPQAQPIVVYNPLGTQTPLTFFHSDADADGLYCRRLAPAIGEHQRFFALAPHGTAGLPILTTIEAMAADYLPRLKALQPFGPYRLGGHCDGGLVAFELARMLCARGDVVEHVLISNAYAPSRGSRRFLDALIRSFGLDESRESRSREKFCTNVDRFARAIDRGPRAMFRFLSERLATSRELAARERQNAIDHPDIPIRPPGTHETKRFFAHLVACFTYHPKPFDGNLTLVWSSGEPVLMGDPTRGDPTKGWSSLANSVRVVAMTGKHNEPIQARVGEFGRHIAEALAIDNGR